MTIQIPVPDAEVAQTRTLPGSFYADPAVYEAEKQANFLKSWHYACPLSALENRSAYVTLQILDQQIVLVRDQDDETRGYFNVRSHHGHRLLEGSGQVQRGFDMGYYPVDRRGNLREDTVRQFHPMYLRWMFPDATRSV